MGEQLISGLVGSGTSLLGSVVNNLFNRSNMKKQYQYNTKLQEQQQQYTTDMWNKNNEYNDPSAQRDRLNAAGLNPIMMNQVQGNISQVATPAAGGSVGLPSSTANITNPLLEAAQIKNLQKDSDVKEAQALLTDQQKQAIEWQNKHTKLVFNAQTMTDLSRLYKEDIENTNSAYLATAFNEELKDGTLNESVVRSFYAQYDSIAKQAVLLDTQNEALKQQNDESKARITNMLSTMLLGYAVFKQTGEIAKANQAVQRYAISTGLQQTKIQSGASKYAADSFNVPSLSSSLKAVAR